MLVGGDVQVELHRAEPIVYFQSFQRDDAIEVAEHGVELLTEIPLADELAVIVHGQQLGSVNQRRAGNGNGARCPLRGTERVMDHLRGRRRDYRQQDRHKCGERAIHFLVVLSSGAERLTAHPTTLGVIFHAQSAVFSYGPARSPITMPASPRRLPPCLYPSRTCCAPLGSLTWSSRATPACPSTRPTSPVTFTLSIAGIATRTSPPSTDHAQAPPAC